MSSTRDRKIAGALCIGIRNTFIVAHRNGKATLASVDETPAVLAGNVVDVGNVMAVDPVGGGTAERRGLDAAATW